MQNWIISIMQQYGYWGVALLIAIENIFPPIPSEVILTFGGFMTTYTFTLSGQRVRRSNTRPLQESEGI